MLFEEFVKSGAFLLNWYGGEGGILETLLTEFRKIPHLRPRVTFPWLWRPDLWYDHH